MSSVMVQMNRDDVNDAIAAWVERKHGWRVPPDGIVMQYDHDANVTGANVVIGPDAIAATMPTTVPKARDLWRESAAMKSLADRLIRESITDVVVRKEPLWVVDGNVWIARIDFQRAGSPNQPWREGKLTIVFEPTGFVIARVEWKDLGIVED